MRHNKYDLKIPEERTRFMEFLLSKSKWSDSGCLLWTGGLVPDGYGKVYVNGKQEAVHRFAYLTFVGPADDLVVRHKCDVRNCWNLDHLQVGTCQDNTLDCMARGRHPSGRTSVTVVETTGRTLPKKANCPLGHAYDEKNTYIRRNGRRRCRTCMNATNRRNRLKRKLEATHPSTTTH